MMANILFVDDEPLTRKLLLQAATILGHQGISASTPEEAMQMAAEHLPDLIVTDVNLEGRQSLEMIEQLKQSEVTKHIPIVTLSALDLVEIQEQARARGAVDSLEKPIRLQTLLEVIRKYAPED